jgi:hypothetical protein
MPHLPDDQPDLSLWRPMNLGGPVLVMAGLLLGAIVWVLGFEGLAG